jgi:hypothetical protein
MNTTKFTPGPWAFDTRGLIYRPSTNAGIARIVGNDLDKQKAEANARLIAASPKLYEALEILLAAIPNNVEEPLATAVANAILVLNEVRGE